MKVLFGDAEGGARGAFVKFWEDERDRSENRMGEGRPHALWGFDSEFLNLMRFYVRFRVGTFGSAGFGGDEMLMGANECELKAWMEGMMTG